MNRKEALENQKKKDDKDFNDVIIDFIIQEPFYAEISFIVNKIQNEKVGTAGVYIEDDQFCMEYSNEFFKKLSYKHKFGLIKHEMLHITLGHITSRRKDNDLIWNIAADLAIHSMMNPEEIVPGGLIPGKRPNMPGMEFLAKQIELLPHGESADWYYNKLIKYAPSDGANLPSDSGNLPIEKNKEEKKKDVKSSGGQKNNDDEDDDNGNDNEKEVTIDSHSKWNNENSDEDEGNGDGDNYAMEQKIKNALSNAIEKCIETGKWGNVPADFFKILQRNIIFEEKIRWQDLIANFAESCRSINKKSTIKKINKRYPYIHPGKKRKRQSKIAICMDQSGSMSDNDITLFFEQLSLLSDLKYEFVVIPFDTIVKEENVFTWKPGDRPDPKRVAHGGTNFSVPTKWINERHKDFDGVIFLTDGFCKKPVASMLPRCWVLNKRGKISFSTEDIIVRMD